jgi:hypothetical protein
MKAHLKVVLTVGMMVESMEYELAVWRVVPMAVGMVGMMVER